MTYRNELAAAQSRGNALERELADTRRRLAAQSSQETSTTWTRLMDRGFHEERRFREAANRQREKTAKKARKQAISEKRSALRAAQFTRFDNSRRHLRSTTKWGWCAHWVFPWLVTSPLLCAFVLFILVPWTLWGLLAWFAFANAIWGLANLWGRYTRSREEGRIAALPFKLRGHRQAMGTDFRDLKVTLTFRGSAPTVPQMQRWVLGLTTEVRGERLRHLVRHTGVEGTNDGIVLSPKVVVTRWMAGNRSYHRWHRRVVEKALVDLHTTFPIALVDVHIDK